MLIYFIMRKILINIFKILILILPNNMKHQYHCFQKTHLMVVFTIVKLRIDTRMFALESQQILCYN